jgi:hypothetical protein
MTRTVRHRSSRTNGNTVVCGYHGRGRASVHLLFCCFALRGVERQCARPQLPGAKMCLVCNSAPSVLWWSSQSCMWLPCGSVARFVDLCVWHRTGLKFRHPFSFRFQVRVVSEICVLGSEAAVWSCSRPDGVGHLPPEQFHAMVAAALDKGKLHVGGSESVLGPSVDDDGRASGEVVGSDGCSAGADASPTASSGGAPSSGVVLLDIRNGYESTVGRFEGAVTPNTRRFSEFPEYVDSHLSEFAGKTVLAYCTGGIRCAEACVD